MAKKFVITTDAKAIDTFINSISRRAKTLRDDVHLAAVSCALHVIEHGNTTLCTKLVNAIEGMRQHDLRQWFIDIGPCVWAETEVVDETTGKVKVKKNFKQNKERVAKLKAMKRDDMIKLLRDEATAFYAKKQGDDNFKPFDLHAELIKLVKRGDKAASKNDKRNDTRGLDQLHQFIRAMNAAKTEAEANANLKELN